MIRTALLEDSDLLADMHKSCFDISWDPAAFKSLLSNKSFFGFIYDAKGFILFQKIFDEIEVITFCVLPHFRNQKLGTKILLHLLEIAKISSVKKIFLEVSEQNIIAQKVYRSCGYHQIDKRPNYYRSANGISDALIMQLIV